MGTRTDLPWLAELQRLAPKPPALVTIHLRDGDTRDVRLPDKRKRWQQVQKAIENCDWVKLEVFGKVKGRNEMVGVIVAEDESGEADGAIEDLKPSKRQEDLALMLKAQDMALLRYERITDKLMTKQNELLDVVIRSVNAVVDIYAHALGVARQGQQPEEQRSMAEQLLQEMAPKLIARAMAPAPAAPNGKAG